MITTTAKIIVTTAITITTVVTMTSIENTDSNYCDKNNHKKNKARERERSCVHRTQRKRLLKNSRELDDCNSKNSKKQF